MDSFSWFSVVVALLSGLAVFLLGLDTLTGALKAQTGDGLRVLIARLTGNRFAGLGTGAVTTILLQSSTITTVISIGLVSGGMLTFTQSLGVVLGANIGTTFTAQVIAFDTSLLGAALLFGGYMLGKLARSHGSKLTGTVVLGLGLVFLGMDVMSDAVRPLRSHEPFIELMESLSSPLLGILVGALFTAMVQSSSAATGVAIAMASEGLIPLEAGVAIIIGSNIGTCVTALLAAIGKPPDAVRTAVFHVIVNVGGALMWFFFIDQLVEIAIALAPSYPELSGLERRAAETPRQFAMAHTVFNVSVALVLVWFLGPIGRMLERIIPDKSPDKEPSLSSALDETLLIAPISAIEAAREELISLGGEVQSMVDDSLDAVLADTSGPSEALASREAKVDVRYLAVLGYLQDILATGPGESAVRRSAVLIDVADGLEEIADVVAMNMLPLTQERVANAIQFQPASAEILHAVRDAVGKELAAAITVALESKAESGGYDDQYRAVETVLDHSARQARTLLHRGDENAEVYAYLSDLLAQYRRIHDTAFRITRTRALKPG
jgi:phosphate:Na+ symporter